MRLKFLKSISILLCLFIHSSSLKLTSSPTASPLTDDDFVQKYDAMMATPVDTLGKLAAIYPKTVEEVNSQLKAGMKLTQMKIDAIIAVPAENRTFDNTVRALDIAQEKAKRQARIFGILGNTSPSQELRKAVLNASARLTSFTIDLYDNPLLYQAFVQYKNLNNQHESLNPENIFLLEDFIKIFHHNGLDLPSHVLTEVNQTRKELMKLEGKFNVNINSDVVQVTVTPDELRGLNQRRIDALQKNGDAYILTIDSSTYVEVMEQCQNSDTRRKVFLAFKNCALRTNESVLQEILKKRDQLAKLLGYQNFASFDLENTMLKNTKNVETFLHNFMNTTLQKAKQEFALLKENLPEGVSCTTDGTLNAWDYLYTVETYKKKHFDVDEAKIAEYFPVQKVIEGVFTIYQNFLGLTFKEVKPEWSWHEDVRLIEIYRQDSQELLGYLFLDLYPRPYKIKHIASHWPQIFSFKDTEQTIPSVSVIVANLPKTSAEIPALLTHNDVVTFFHEFGHAMHTVLAKTEHAHFAGTTVKADFVEMPSQMFEEWMYEPKILKLVSHHYQTGEPLPDDLIAKKIALKEFDAGYTYLNICARALFALQLMQDLDSSYSPSTLWHDNVHNKYLAEIISYEEQNHFYTSWWHLAQPEHYASKFYGYLWAKVLAMDVFAKIKESGFNKISSQQIQKLLSAGGSIDPNQLMRDFLGREPNQDAFLEAFGLK